jgi:KUP system potassium uptake protein
MVLTTALLYHVMRKLWHWASIQVFALTSIFLVVDLAFFSANLLKIGEGGWIPLTFGVFVFIVMTTWHSGIASLQRRNASRSKLPAEFFESLNDGNVVRVPGAAIFLTRLADNIPPIIVDYVKQTGSLHETVVALSVSFERIPRIHPNSRINVVKLAKDFWHITVHFGFVENPDLPCALAMARKQGVPIFDGALYYTERNDLVSRKYRGFWSRSRMNLFSFMSRNSARAIDRFKIPSNALIEIGRRIEL